MDGAREELAGFDPFALMAVEYRRLEDFLAGVSGEGWSVPTLLPGWTRRELLCHLAGAEVYHLAGLDDDLDGLYDRAAGAGYPGMSRFNEWMISIRAGKAPEEILAEWSNTGPETVRRLAERAPDGMVSTSVGPYPVVLQAFHLAMHAAIHAADLSIAIDPTDHAERSKWGAAFCRFAVPEAGSAASIERSGDENLITLGDVKGRLSDEELCSAVAGHLPDSHPLPGVLKESIHIF